MNKLTFNICVVLIQLSVLSTAENLTTIIETTGMSMNYTTPMTPSTTILQETTQNVEKSQTGRTPILRIEPEEEETSKIVDILMNQVVVKEKLYKNDTQENWEATTGKTTEKIEEEKEPHMDNSTIPNIGLTDANTEQNIGIGTTEQQNIEIATKSKISDPATLEEKMPNDQKDTPSASPSPSSQPRESEKQDKADNKVNVIVEQIEPAQHQETGEIPPSLLAQPDKSIGDQAKLNIEDAASKQVSPMESTTSVLELGQTVPVVLSRGSEAQDKVEKGVSEAEVEKRDEHMATKDQKPLEASGSETQGELTTNIVPEKVEDTTTKMDVEITEKPTLLERMIHNRHRKFKSEEEEDKSDGPVPCTCGVFLSGQFKKGSKQQPKGMPVLTQETDTPFMNNAVGNRHCTNKCLELIIKHLPKSSEIICATVDRENVFKERAYLFVKNHSDKWHGTNLSAGREFCCRDNTPYKCPVSQ